MNGKEEWEEWVAKQHALMWKRTIRLLRYAQVDKELIEVWKTGSEAMTTILLVQILRELKKLGEPKAS